MSGILDTDPVRRRAGDGAFVASRLLRRPVMTNTRPRRALVARLLRPRSSRRPVHVVGACTACGANFAGGPGQENQVAEILRVHEALCPGGRRAGELVRPFG